MRRLRNLCPLHACTDQPCIIQTYVGSVPNHVDLVVVDHSFKKIVRETCGPIALHRNRAKDSTGSSGAVLIALFRLRVELEEGLLPYHQRLQIEEALIFHFLETFERILFRSFQSSRRTSRSTDARDRDRLIESYDENHKMTNTSQI
jgi:hypothetical protein